MKLTELEGGERQRKRVWEAKPGGGGGVISRGRGSRRGHLPFRVTSCPGSPETEGFLETWYFLF